MFEQVFIEESIRDHPRTLSILSKLRLKSEPRAIRKIEDVFGRVRKPYLQKRSNLNLFLGRKEGALVKPAPPAYGLDGSPHYYFIHQYNCIFECEYCYLQGYFSSPDIVFFVNHDEIVEEMTRLVGGRHAQEKEVWFHAGEFSDSLALSQITGEMEIYWKFLQENPRAKIELRTKSVQTRTLESLGPLPNLYLSYSVSPSEQAEKFDRRTASTAARLRSAKKMADLGYKIGLHLDPVIFAEESSFRKTYHELVEQIFQSLAPKQIAYVSIGVVRFTKDVFRQVGKNYPRSHLRNGDYVVSFDGKVRYHKPLRMKLLSQVKKMLVDARLEEEKIYLCMED